MRRIMATLAVMTLLLAATAAPAFAAAKPGGESNCVGEVASQLNQPHGPFSEPGGSGGELISDVAQEGVIGETASTNCLER
jgi:hypothetical protein